MKSYIMLLGLGMTAVLASCAKKKLPEPPQKKNTTPTESLIPPCDSALKSGRITSNKSFEGYDTLQVNIDVWEHFGYIELRCDHYWTHNKYILEVDTDNLFIGRKKYTLSSYQGDPSANYAKLRHEAGGFGYYLNAESGDLYANYTKDKIEFSFCDVVLKNSDGNSHKVSGKLIIDKEQ